MERLCDDILQLIFVELDEPADFAASSKRLYAFSQDPYVRANYFLERHGRLQALFWAFWRGRVLNPKVIDTLLSCGAHVSRYFVQVSMGHYFRNQAPFIKGPWVRSLDFQTFMYFLGKAGEMFGNIPPEKGKDDGTVFSTFLEESRLAKAARDVKWEDVRDVLEKYKFIPFCPKDPLMAQFPLALSVEPRLLPFALANGFRMDCKYRDFVFRKMFEKRYGSLDTQADDIVQHARDLCRLDKRMFLSRTVAAEICMEAKFNEPAFTALKRLHQSGDLLYDLGVLVEDLIKLFAGSRAMTQASTSAAAHYLYNAFPSSDPVVRHVLFVSLFHSDAIALPNADSNERAAAVREKLQPLKLGPISRSELIDVLSDPFIERSDALVDYAQVDLKMGKKEIRQLVQDAACQALEEVSKGTGLKILLGKYAWLKSKLVEHAWEKHRLRVSDLPPSHDEQACVAFQAKLARKIVSTVEKSRGRSNPAPATDVPTSGAAQPEGNEVAAEGVEDADASMEVDGMESGPHSNPLELGDIGIDTLSNAIKKDEMDSRGRRRGYWTWYLDREVTSAKETHPSGAVQVAKWVYSTYGARSPITAVFMDHAVVNGNEVIIKEYLDMNGWPPRANSAKAVPVTLKHFQLLARLGREPSHDMWRQLELGTEFYTSEDDYLGKEPVKKEDLWESPPGLLVSLEERQRMNNNTDSTDSLPGPSHPGSSPLTSPATSPEPSSRKRPRRSATNHVKSYAIPDSDDEDIADEGDEFRHYFAGSASPENKRKPKRPQETSQQLWIRHLTILQKEEQLKYKEKRKRTESTLPFGKKTRTPKSPFFKSLNDRLRMLQQFSDNNHGFNRNDSEEDDSYSEPEDEREYRDKPSKRRKRV